MDSLLRQRPRIQGYFSDFETLKQENPICYRLHCLKIYRHFLIFVKDKEGKSVDFSEVSKRKDCRNGSNEKPRFPGVHIIQSVFQVWIRGLQELGAQRELQESPGRVPLVRGQQADSRVGQRWV